MAPEHISRRRVLRSTAVGGLAASALAGLTVSRTAAASADTLHPAVGVWENLAPRIDIPDQAFHNQFAFLFGGIAIFASPPVDVEPGDVGEFSGPFDRRRKRCHTSLLPGSRRGALPDVDHWCNQAWMSTCAR
jgi:hypothetical protein